METATRYEEEILKAIHNLSEHGQKKLLKVICFFTKETIAPLPKEEKRQTEEFLSVCGTWEDDRNVEEQIDDIYSARKSRETAEGII